MQRKKILIKLCKNLSLRVLTGPLTILTLCLGVIVATYKCECGCINLSVSFSWCSSCSLFVTPSHCWWTQFWQPTVQPAQESHRGPASGDTSSTNPGQGPPLIDRSVWVRATFSHCVCMTCMLTKGINECLNHRGFWLPRPEVYSNVLLL